MMAHAEAGFVLRLDLFRRGVEEIGGLAKTACGIAQAAGADRGIGVEVGVGGPCDPEGEFCQGFQRLPERLGRRAVDAPGHGAAIPAGAMSMRSPQGSRFQSSGGSDQLQKMTGNGGSASG